MNLITSFLRALRDAQALSEASDLAVTATRRAGEAEAEAVHARAVVAAFKKRVVVLIEETDALKAELRQRDMFEKALVNAFGRLGRGPRP